MIVSGVDKEAGRSDRGRHSATATTGALQGQGRPLQRRAGSAQGRQGREAMSKNRLAQRRRRHFRVRKSVIGNFQSSPPGGVSEQPLPLRPGDRRHDRPHSGRSLVPGSGLAHAHPHGGYRDRGRKAGRQPSQGRRSRGCCFRPWWFHLSRSHQGPGGCCPGSPAWSSKEHPWQILNSTSE